MNKYLLILLPFVVPFATWGMDEVTGPSHQEVTANNLSPKQTLKRMANQGNCQAQFDLGMLYLDEGTATSYTKGFEWLDKAAMQDHTSAEIQLTKILLNLLQKRLAGFLKKAIS